MSGKNNHDEGGIFNLVFGMLIAMYALPLIGAYLMVTGKSDGKKALGVVLLIIGVVLWISFAGD